MNSTIKRGTVFAGSRTPAIHNEIVKVYMSREHDFYGRNVKMVDVEQYGSTLATQDVQRKVTFFAREINRMLNSGNAHIVLVR